VELESDSARRRAGDRVHEPATTAYASPRSRRRGIGRSDRCCLRHSRRPRVRCVGNRWRSGAG